MRLCKFACFCCSLELVLINNFQCAQKQNNKALILKHPKSAIDFWLWPFFRGLCQDEDKWKWIGLVNTGGSCSCLGVSDAVCRDCRSRWTWTDGSPVNYSNWADGEPNTHELCTAMDSDGFWRGHDCTWSKFKFICKLGKYWCVDAGFLVSGN